MANISNLEFLGGLRFVRLGNHLSIRLLRYMGMQANATHLEIPTILLLLSLLARSHWGKSPSYFAVVADLEPVGIGGRLK